MKSAKQVLSNLRQTVWPIKRSLLINSLLVCMPVLLSSVSTSLISLPVYAATAVAQDRMEKEAGATKIQSIRWTLNHFPPYIILTDGLPGKGAAAEFVHYAIKQLPGYQHTVEMASFPRVIGLMKDKASICNPLLLKTPEREDFIEFSLPIIMALPHHIVIDEKNLSRIRPFQNESGKIDISKLLQDSDLVTAITQDRAYPKIISPAIAEAAKRSHIIKSSADIQTPIKQLAAGWIDYIIAYPFEVHWHLNHGEGRDTAHLKYLPIDGMPEYVLSHIGCTKNEQGKRVIRSINQVIKQAGAQPPWQETQFGYLDVEARKRLKALLQRYQPFGALD